MATIFKTVTRTVEKKGTYNVVQAFNQRIENASVALQSISLTNTDSKGHYRGPTKIEVSNISIEGGKEVRFQFYFDFSQNDDDDWWQMKGTISFLIIAVTE